MAEQHRILVVDDDPNQVEIIREALERLGHHIEEARGGRSAIEMIRASAFDLLVVDIVMPEVSGLDVVDHAQKQPNSPEIILVTGYPSLDSARQAMERGVQDYLTKPLSLSELELKVQNALERRRLARENLMLREIASIHEATRALTLVHNMDDLLDLIMDKCFVLTKAESGSIMLVEEGRPGLVVSLVRGRTDDRVLKVGTRLTEGIACWVGANGEPVLIRDREIIPDIGFKSKPDWTLGSAISLPLKVEEKVRGVVNLNRSAGASRFDQVDLRVASVMALQAGTFIENALLQSRLRRNIEEMEQANRRAEEAYRQLIQAEKLSTIGLMAGTVAHDINNPLAIIEGRAQLLMYSHPEDTDIGKALRTIKSQAERISNLVRSLQRYARKGKREFRPVNVVDCLDESFVLVEKLLYHNRIETVRRYGEGLPAVMGNPTEIEQIFMNLIQNAAQAMQQGGTLMVEARVRDGEPAEGDIQAHPFLEVAIADTGEGIPADALESIFEPFYTTKAEGQGTGLGLPICRRIIKDHKGTIAVESEPGKGTVFRVRFPLAPDSPPQNPP